MPQYKKKYRTFYKLTDKKFIITVFNGFATSHITIQSDVTKEFEVFQDPYKEFQNCTPEEFDSMYKEALKKFNESNASTGSGVA